MTDTASAARRMFKALNHRHRALEKGEPLSPPLISASKFALPGALEAVDQYGRYGTPTWRAAEDLLACLEDAETLAFPSGMAACAAILQSILKPGDRLVLPSDGYYTVRRQAELYLADMGVEIVLHPTADYLNAPVDGARLVWVESPANPGLDVCDIRAVAARAKAAGALVAADNTTMTAFLQRPLDLGVDIVACSDTKAAGGHSDALFGHVASRDADLMEAVRAWRTTIGAIPGAMEAWLIHRGLETLDVRLQRMCANAASLAAEIRNHPALVGLRYPGLDDDPSYDIAKRQMDEFGFLLGLTFRSEQAADAFVEASETVFGSTSFGGVNTSADRRARWGDDVPEGYLRVSVGCEPFEPLRDDVLAALDAAARR